MIDHVGDQLAGRSLGLHAGDELATRRTHHLNLDFRKTLVECLDHLLFDLGEIRRVVDQLAFPLGRCNQFGRTELLLRQRRRTVRRDAETGDSGHGGYLDGYLASYLGDNLVVHGQSSLGFFYPARATLPWAAPLDSQFAPPIRTPSKTVCTRLNAAVLPRFPPS